MLFFFYDEDAYINCQSDEVANKILEVAKHFDSSAYTKPWNGKKQRPLAFMHYGNEKDPGLAYRAEITSAKDKIYWWIGLESPMYKKYAAFIDPIDDDEWRAKYEETRIIFYSVNDFFSFVNRCLGEINDINIAVWPKALSEDGTDVVCPRCEEKFKRAARCPECGQLIKYI